MLDLLDNLQDTETTKREINPSPAEGFVRPAVTAFGADFSGGMSEFDKWYFDKFDNSKIVPHDQLPEYIKSSVGAHASIGENEVAFLEQSRQREEENNQILNNTPDHWWDKAGVAGAGLLGMLLSPPGVLSGGLGGAAVKGTSIAAKYVLPKIMTDSIGTLASKNLMTKSLYNISKMSGQGAIAMGVGMTPFQYADQKALFYPADYWDITTDNLKQGAMGGLEIGGVAEALGLGIRGFSGVMRKRNIYEKSTTNTAQQKVSDELINDLEPSTDKLQDADINNLKNKIGNEEYKNYVEENIESQKLKDSIDSQIDTLPKSDLENNTTLGNLNKLVEIYRKDEMTKDENEFRSNLLDIPLYKQLSDIQAKMIHERTKDDHDLLYKSFDLDHELGNIYTAKDLTEANLNNYNKNTDIENYQNQLNKLNSIENKTKQNVKDISKLKQFIKNLKTSEKYNNLNKKDLYKKLEFYNKRIDEINELKKHPEEVKKLDEINHLKLIKDAIQNRMDNNQALINAVDNGAPISKSDVIDELNYNKTESKKAYYSPEAEAYWNDHVSKVEPTDFKSIDDIDRKYENMIDEDTKEELKDDLENKRRLVDKIDLAYKRMAECVMRNKK